MNERTATDAQEPLTDADLRRMEDGTLGGYLDTHSRPPAFYGPDAHPYTISVETEQVGSLDAPYAGFLVFPRFALSGVGVVGHVETPFLWRGSSPREIEQQAGELTLRQVKELLDEAVGRRRSMEEAEREGERESEPDGTPEC